MSSATLELIDREVQELADARSELQMRVQGLEDEMRKVKRKYLAAIKRAVARAAAAETQIREMIQASPELFQKPRTMVLHGIKVGWQKNREARIWDDDDRVVKLIKRHFPKDWEIFVRVKETPIADVLGTLPAEELERLGVRIIPAQDRVIVRPVDSEVDKLVEGLMAEVCEEGEAGDE